MKAKLLLLAVAVLALAASGFAVPMISLFTETDQVLTTTCDGTTPIPDGTMYYLFHDANGTGPFDGAGIDMADVLGSLCPNAPDCIGGNTGDVNFNALPFNGEAMGLGAGLFYAENYFVTQGDTISPNRWYLRAYYPSIDAPAIVWSSAVVSPVGGISELEMTGWVCTVLEVPCIGTESVTLVPSTQEPYAPQDVEAVCANLCATTVTTICVGPLSRDNRIPHITVGEGPCCPNPVPFVLGDAWTWTLIGDFYYYCTTIALLPGAAEGCVAIDLDFIEPVELRAFDVIPMDASVAINWTTASETGVARFEIVRDGAVVGMKEAANSTSGAEYRFIDEDVQNGHAYKYELVLVNLDNSREVMGTVENVIPSLDKAVITEYALGQNYPNPFNPTTRISFDLVDDNPVTLTVYNAAGQLVTTLLNNKSMPAGRQTITFDATNMTSGLYFYTVKIGNEFTATKKMLLVK